jgi:hypothetical protein
LIALALAALAALLAWSGATWRADRLLYDTALSALPRPVAPDIVIIAIDDASIAAIGRWPWPRTVHATLLDRLAAARPRAIALDLVLSEPDPDPAQDHWLALALGRVAAAGVPVVMPVPWVRTGGAGWSTLPPTGPLGAHVRLGAAEPAVDDDGVLRHLFLLTGPTQAPYPHLALALLEAAGGQLHPALRPEWAPPVGAGDGGSEAGGAGWRRDGRLLLRYAGAPGSVPRLSYLAVLQGQVPAAALAGRTLLIGMTAQGLGDTLATPVNARQRAMPGVEVLAQSLQMLRSGEGLRAVSPATLAAGSALAVLVLVGLFRRIGARRALVLALSSVPLAVLASAASLAAGWAWSPVPYAAAALLAYPLWSWRRLEQTVAVLDREIQALAAERLDEDPAPRRADTPGPDLLTNRLRDLAQAATLVREARRFLAGAVEGLPTAVLVGDAAGRVVLANRGAAALFEVDSAADLQGLDLPRLLAECRTQPALPWPAALAALRPGAAGLSVEARLAGGDHLVHVAAIDLQGERRLIVSMADLAPVREAQRQREEVLAFVSHDLRAPAHALLLLTDPAGGPAALPVEQLLPELRRLAARTLALSEDFVQAARAQTRPLQPLSVAPSVLLDEGVADLQAAAGAVGLTLQTRCVDDRPARLDRALVVRALSNLVANAVRHSPAGAVVQVSAEGDADTLVLRVRDAGPGFAADQAAALRSGDDGVRVSGPRGVGLGLVFVQRVVRRHGGHLQVADGAPGDVALVLPRRGPA